MAPKKGVADIRAAFQDDDTTTCGHIFAKPPKRSSRSSSQTSKDVPPKRAKPGVEQNPLSSLVAPTSAAAGASSAKDGAQQLGKSRFYKEFARLRQGDLHGILFGHGELLLQSKPEDYGEMQVYSGSSSSSEMSLAKEETYRIDRSLGADSRSRVVGMWTFAALAYCPGRMRWSSLMLVRAPSWPRRWSVIFLLLEKIRSWMQRAIILLV